MVAEGFAAVDVAQMHFYDGYGDGANGVEQGDGGMCVGAGVEYDAIKACFIGAVELFDQMAFDVTLVVVEFHVGVLGFQGSETFLHCGRTIDARFTSAEALQIGAVENKYLHILIILRCGLIYTGNGKIFRRCMGIYAKLFSNFEINLEDFGVLAVKNPK